MSNKDIATALKASTRSSSWGRKVVGRLLSPIELDEVAGGGGSCNGGGNHAQGSGTNFTQAGGSFNQNAGGSYNMNCRSTSVDPLT